MNRDGKERIETEGSIDRQIDCNRSLRSS